MISRKAYSMPHQNYCSFHEPCNLEAINGAHQVHAYRVRSVVLLLHTLLTASYGDWLLLSVIEIDLNGNMHKFADCVTIFALILLPQLCKVHESCSTKLKMASQISNHRPRRR